MYELNTSIICLCLSYVYYMFQVSGLHCGNYTPGLRSRDASLTKKECIVSVLPVYCHCIVIVHPVCCQCVGRLLPDLTV